MMQRLAREGLVESSRGPKGGFKLRKPPEKIDLLDVYEAIEGPLRPTKCLLGKPVCDAEHCIFGGVLDKVNKLVGNYMAKTRLPELTDVFGGNDENA